MTNEIENAVLELDAYYGKLSDIDNVLAHHSKHQVTMNLHLERIAQALELIAKKPSTITEAPEQQLELPLEEVKESVSEQQIDLPLEEVKTYTHADLKAACLASCKADMKNRLKVKALLADYNAVKAVDVAEDKLAEVIGKIERGEF